MEEKQEFLNALAELKTKLEQSLTEKSDEKIKSAEEKIAAVEKALVEVQAKEAATPEELKTVKADLEATMKALDILQVRIKHAQPAKQEEVKSFDVRLKEAIEEAGDKIAKFIRKEVKSFDIELKDVGDVTTANVTGTTVWGAQSRSGLIMNPSRKTHMRSMLRVLPAGPGTDYYFMRENGEGEGSIATVAEGAAKPQFDLDLVESSVKFETIAGWMRISKKALNNIPGLTAFLQSRLPEKLLNVEDSQILYGDGTSPNLKGIGTSGNFTTSVATAAQVLIEKIISDISNMEDTSEVSANFGLLRPADYYGFFLNKASGSGEYDLPQGVSIVDGQLYFLGIPFYASTAVKKDAVNGNDYFIGDLNGADILQQESMRIEFFEQDTDNVQKNKVTVRIEEVIALPVYGSRYFVKGNTKVTTP